MVNIGRSHYNEHLDDKLNSEERLCNCYEFEGLCDLVDYNY